MIGRVSEEAISRGEIRDGDERLTMVVEDVVVTALMGTVLLGRLRGPGRVRAGDWALCDELRLEITSIEQFRSAIAEAEAGPAAVGLGQSIDARPGASSRS